MLAHRYAGCRDQFARERGPDTAPTIKAKCRQPSDRSLTKCMRCWVVGQNCGREFRIETAHVAGEFWKDEIERPMEIAYAVTEVLDSPLAQMHHLPQLLF